jgi:BirA family biotin operon repressor/biotin-[acetyl-CoA-carboxylase] ligase
VSGAGVSLPGLQTKWLGGHYLHLDEVDSTNNFLMRHLDFLHGQTVTASLQTAGKGRLGRNWHAGRDSSLMLSFLLRDWPLDRLSALPLVVGLGVCRTVEAVANIAAAIKWSNDVLVGERKICGILCESRITPNSLADVVVGLGVNLLQSARELEELSLVYATSLLLATGKEIDPFFFASNLLGELEILLENYAISAFPALREAYAARCLTLGREVELISPQGDVRRGTALGIGDEGELLCRIEGVVTPIRAGEVSVRGIYGYV